MSCQNTGLLKSVSFFILFIGFYTLRYAGKYYNRALMSTKPRYVKNLKILSKTIFLCFAELFYKIWESILKIHTVQTCNFLFISPLLNWTKSDLLKQNSLHGYLNINFLLISPLLNWTKSDLLKLNSLHGYLNINHWA